jgi:acyl-CoA synthetase (AMP-forming)/AMP-acid ligase II
MLRHRNLMAVATNTIQGFEIASETVFLNAAARPIAQVILMSHLFAGATVVLGPRFDAERFSAMIDVRAVPRGHRWCRRSSCGGSSICGRRTGCRSWKRSMWADRAFPPRCSSAHSDLVGPRIGVLYGMTEAPVCCYLRPQHSLEAIARAHRTVGHPLPAYRVRIDGADGENAPGEVLVQGDNVMAGYWQNEEATRNVLRDGWLHTGDIGTFDRDAGVSRSSGRLKDVIRSGSSSIMPKEVEDVIATHPAVGEVAVLLPDPEWGEAVTAFVVLRPGVRRPSRSWWEHRRRNLASYKKRARALCREPCHARTTARCSASCFGAGDKLAIPTIISTARVRRSWRRG